MPTETRKPFASPIALIAALAVVLLSVWGMKLAFDVPTTTLAGPIAADAKPGDRFTLSDGVEFTGFGHLRIGNEVIEAERVYQLDSGETWLPVTGGPLVIEHPDSFQIVSRGALGTSVGDHADGAEVTEERSLLLPVDNNPAFGHKVDSLFMLILWITGIVFILTEAFLVYCIWAYRKRAGSRSHYTHGNARLELFWIVSVSVILVFLAVVQNAAWNEIKEDFPTAEDGALVVQVVAKQFEWNFRLAGKDDVFGTLDDIPMTGTLHVPAGRKIFLNMRSQDVIHSFFLNDFRLKQDIVPGMNVPAWFIAGKPGHFQIMCAELCGLGHTRMGGRLVVMEPAAFQTWSDEQSSIWEQENDGFDRSEWFGGQSGLWWWWDRNPTNVAFVGGKQIAKSE